MLEAGITWTWPKTDVNEIASLQCPCEARPDLTKGVRAVRRCLETGKWGSVNVKTCFSEVQRLLCNVCALHAVLFRQTSLLFYYL